MKASICILTFNRISILKELLHSLKTIKHDSLEIIVIDNHSEDGTDLFIKANHPEIKYYRTDKNIGVAARNIGLRNAKGEIVITIDDDISDISGSDINNLISFFEKNKSVGALNFKVVDSETGDICNWVHHRPVELYSNKEFETYEITEGAVAFRKKAIEKAGLYPEHFFISHEGPDLAFRLLSEGYEVKFSNLVTVKHAHAQEGRKPWYRYYYDTRNQFYLAARNFPLSYSLKYLTIGALSMFVYSLRDGFLTYWYKGVSEGLQGIKKYAYQRNVLTATTMKKIRQIDKMRPSFIYMVKKRLFSKEVRL